MAKQNDLTKLNRLKSDKEDIVSIYLNCDQRRYTPEVIEQKLKDLLKKVEDKLGADVRKKIWDWIELDLQEDVRGMAFFVSSDKDLWVVYKFPCSVKSGAYVERDIHMEQFLYVLDELEKYCTVICDKEKAKIFTVFLGQMQDFSYIFDDTPRKTKRGGWSQKNNQAWVQNEVTAHLKNVAEQTYRLFKEQNFDRLFLGGQLETIAVLREVLHPDLQKRVAGIFGTELFKPNEYFLKQSLKAQEKAERKNEARLVEDLNNNLNGNLAVAGLKKVLAVAMERDMKMLLVDSKMSTSGRQCPNCDFLGLDETTCPYCEAKTEKVLDVIDELIQKAFNQRAKIEFVVDSEKLSELGGVGAMMRF